MMRERDLVEVGASFYMRADGSVVKVQLCVGEVGKWL